MTTDWSESHIRIKAHLEQLMQSLNKGQTQDAMELTFAIESELAKLRNYCWRNLK